MEEINYKYDRFQLLTFNVPNQLEILKSLPELDIDVIEIKTRDKEERDITIFFLNHKGYKLVGKTIKSLIFLHHRSFFMEHLEKFKS